MTAPVPAPAFSDEMARTPTPVPTPARFELYNTLREIIFGFYTTSVVQPIVN